MSSSSISVSGNQSRVTGSLTSNLLSTPSIKNLDSSPDLEEGLHYGSCLVDSCGDTTKKMKTRVAVRDKNPHRFQVVPLRDITKLQAALSQTEATTHLTSHLPSSNYLICSPSSQSTSYAQPWAISHSTSTSIPSFGSRNGKENKFHMEFTDLSSSKQLGYRDTGLISGPDLHLVFNEVGNDQGCSYNKYDEMLYTGTAGPGHLTVEEKIDNLLFDSRTSVTKGSLQTDNTQIMSDVLSSGSLRAFSMRQRTYSRNPNLTLNLLKTEKTHYELKPWTPLNPDQYRKSRLMKHHPAADVISNVLDDPFSPDKNTSRTSKRHAIYTPLFLPYAQDMDLLRGESTVDSTSTTEITMSTSDSAIPIDSDKTMRQFRINTTPFQTSFNTPITPPRLHGDCLTSGSVGSTDFGLVLPLESPQFHSSPKPLIFGSSRRLKTKNKLRLKIQEPCEPEGGYGHCQLMLEIIADIDAVVLEWGGIID